VVQQQTQIISFEQKDICSDTSDPAGFGRRRKRQSPFQNFPSFSGFSQNFSGNFQPEVRFEPVPIRVLVPQGSLLTIFFKIST